LRRTGPRTSAGCSWAATASISSTGGAKTPRPAPASRAPCWCATACATAALAWCSSFDNGVVYAALARLWARSGPRLGFAARAGPAEVRAGAAPSAAPTGLRPPRGRPLAVPPPADGSRSLPPTGAPWPWRAGCLGRRPAGWATRWRQQWRTARQCRAGGAAWTWARPWPCLAPGSGLQRDRKKFGGGPDPHCIAGPRGVGSWGRRQFSRGARRSVCGS
jgi:hypothetical protein